MNDANAEEQHNAPEHRALPCPRRVRFKTIVLGFVILFCGIVIGGGGALVFVYNTAQFLIQHPEELPKEVAEFVQRRHSLTDEETAAVQKILEARQKALEEIRLEVRPQVLAELDKIREEVAEVMPPEEAEIWRERFERVRDQWLPPLLEPKDKQANEQ